MSVDGKADATYGANTGIPRDSRAYTTRRVTRGFDMTKTTSALESIYNWYVCLTRFGLPDVEVFMMIAPGSAVRTVSITPFE